MTNGSLGNVSCKKSVTVGEIKPKIVCPNDKTAKVGSTVSVTPKSLIGCGTGCSYTIVGAGASEASGYTGGVVSFTGASKAGDKDYTFRVTNSKGDDECNFTVTYTESASGCNCTCSTGCDDLYSGSSIEGGQPAKHCLFATTITEINEFYDRNPIMVNGKRPGYCSNGDNNNLCTNKLASLEKIDGGYYIETPITSGDSAWFKVEVGGSRTPDCESESSDAISLALTNTDNNSGGPLADGSSYKVTAIGSCSNVRFNCWTENGCSIAVNSGSPVVGYAWQSNYVVSPMPSVGDVLHVTGTVTQIWCANW